ncbi:UpxY family transcription antiterminator [uncultured Shewanella sp.]|uniref:UpxY family transcription antiterminator n=1 Tax=uncultured Shewanella sp. TaxID=173975 RepID=UPI0026208598|nr:UpxY family transcription antiterminator [uncultured Shewanella sp.]
MKQWYAIYTAANAEQKLYKRVIASGIEAYLPLERITRQWSDRKKVIVKPIFKSYLFVYQDIDDYYTVTRFPGFLQYVRFGNKVSVISDSEMRLMKLIVDSVNSKKITAGLIKGDKVRIVSGSLKGYVGVLIKFEGESKVALHIKNLKHSFVLNIPMDNIVRC